MLATYWELRRIEQATYDFVKPNYIGVFKRVMSTILTDARKMPEAKSLSFRFDSRPHNFQELPDLVQVSELQKEFSV